VEETSRSWEPTVHDGKAAVSSPKIRIGIGIEIEIPVAIMLYNDVASIQQRSFPNLDASSEHCTQQETFSFSPSITTHGTLQLSVATFDELSMKYRGRQQHRMQREKLTAETITSVQVE